MIFPASDFFSFLIFFCFLCKFAISCNKDSVLPKLTLILHCVLFGDSYTWKAGRGEYGNLRPRSIASINIP